MRQSRVGVNPGRVRSTKESLSRDRKGDGRYSVSLDRGVVEQVERYARAQDSSMSKAIASLVRLGLQGQEERKREFFKKLRANLANDDPGKEDEMIDQFRTLILGN